MDEYIILPSRIDTPISEWSTYFNDYGYYSVLFQFVLAVVFALILAPFSVGLFIYIVFYFIFELLYANYRGFRYSITEVLLRFAIFLSGLVAFIFARWAIGDDNPIRHHYDKWEF